MAYENTMRQERDGRMVSIGGHQIEIAYDPDGEGWYVRAASVPGLTGEADTAEALLAALPRLIADATLP